MIGVIAKPGQKPLVEEFFELFKTPWEFYRPGSMYDVVVATGDGMPSPMPLLLVRYGAAASAEDSPVATTSRLGQVTIIRVGFDLFEQVRLLLSQGQRLERAHIPTLDLHIATLRRWILEQGLPLVEIHPSPAAHDFAVCLTHDIDFVGIRRHLFDHTMWGFLYRATVGGLRDAVRRRLPIGRLLKMWRAAASLPFVYAGWLADFWEPFEWYLDVERGLPATYYLIPFKHRPGEKVSGRHAERRGTAYDISDVPESAARLIAAGCEVGVHGIDAWHSVESGRAEMARITDATGGGRLGIRMHWLLRDQNTSAVLEQAGYGYDSTAGYNETVGYRAGTTQVFRPIGARALLELPMHIQDGALFYPQRLNLTEDEAGQRCQVLIDHARQAGGVLTVLWHDRSHGPERFWGEFYQRLVAALRSTNAWFGTGSQVVGWFRARRAVRFARPDAADSGRVSLCYQGDPISPPLRVRIHRPSADRREGLAEDIAWNGETPLDLDLWHRPASGHQAPLRTASAR